ncbi:hypothetical protein A2154_01290 [Candidatus Gottesmanbacteria bacterium RBG_16_43_7]|uniref:Transglycosylase SLT domain-containing protein n=1 Tax=Candidatus Gottesmanbacteria bacterium RBG_16_43_7 TaxID=1798373 RepID=A0A1F5Z8B9_9BACT|nr:MAG: hypothetical protein A2154_01290 [Candidatus Gottesmanbacteria bacterium RBG_16_43_7]
MINPELSELNLASDRLAELYYSGHPLAIWAQSRPDLNIRTFENRRQFTPDNDVFIIESVPHKSRDDNPLYFYFNYADNQLLVLFQINVPEADKKSVVNSDIRSVRQIWKSNLRRDIAEYPITQYLDFHLGKLTEPFNLPIKNKVWIGGAFKIKQLKNYLRVRKSIESVNEAVAYLADWSVANKQEIALKTQLLFRRTSQLENQKNKLTEKKHISGGTPRLHSNSQRRKEIKPLDYNPGRRKFVLFGLSVFGASVYLYKTKSLGRIDTILKKVEATGDNPDSIVLNITPVSQRDEPIEYQTVLGYNPSVLDANGNLVWSLARQGCLLETLLAYRIALGHNQDTAVSLNEILKANGGYDAGTGLYRWEQGGKALGFTGLERSADYSNKPVDADGLIFCQNRLAQHKPVITRVDFNTATARPDTHFVLTFGYQLDQNNQKIYLVMDPWDGTLNSIPENFFTRYACQFYAYDQEIPANESEIPPKQIDIGGLISILFNISEDIDQIKTNDQADNDFTADLSKYPDKVQKWGKLINHYANKHNLPPALIAALIWQESGGNPTAYSRSGAVGLMQVMPRDGIAAQFMCQNGPCFADRPSIQELQDPEFNISYGTKMLAGLFQRYKNRGLPDDEALREALKSYGPMNVGYYYADKVLALWTQYGN